MPASDAARRIGRVTVFKAISQGGMAVVHYGRLHGESGFSRPVAIKRLLPQLTEDPQFVAMLMDEARIAGRVQHPNVVQILDVIEEDGVPLLVLEYVHGASLANLLRILSESQAQMPVAIASAIAVDALRGLQAAHEARDETGQSLEVVHRDVSPQNILLDVNGLARVTDFGVAKARGRAQRSTDNGYLKGKLGYLAPEQIHGSVTRRSDLFAVAIVLWEMLTGIRLFRGDSEGAVLGAILSGRIDPPTKRGATCSRELDLVVMKGLEREAERRFASATEMADAIAAAEKPATPAEVAAWLQRVAEPLLEQRAAIVRELESSPDVAAGESATSAVRSIAGHAPNERSHWRAAFVGAAVALSLGIGIVGARAVWHSDRGTEAPKPDPTPIASEAPLATVEEPAVMPSATAIPTTSGSSVSASKPRAVRPVLKSTKPDCTVPFDLDAQGRKIWRRECFGRGAPK